MKIRVGVLRRIIQEALTQVDTDPSNNPGRPDDAYDYLGMHPKPEWAMAHPASGGGEGGGGADGSSEAEPGEEGAAPEGGDEPTESP